MVLVIGDVMKLDFNMLIKYLFVTLAIALISSTSSAITVEGALSSIRVGDNSYHSVLDHKEEVVYEQVAADVPVKQEINKQIEQKNLNSVAGVTIDGYSKLILKKVNENTLTIEGDRQEYFNKNEAVVLKYKVLGKFVKGTWSDLISDKPVKIVFEEVTTAKAKSTLKAYIEKVIKNVANNTLAEMAKSKQLGQRVKARTVGEFTRAEILADKFKLHMVALEGTKKQLKQTFLLDTQFKLHNK